MDYIFDDTRVYVSFYTRDRWWATLLSGTDLLNCAVMFERNNRRVILAAAPTHRPKLVDADKFHESWAYPKHVIELGMAPVCLKQIDCYISNNYRGDVRSIFFWAYFGKYFFPRLLPRTCALLTCNVLRVCGFRIKDHIQPLHLFKELTNANDYHCWSSGSWKDYVSQDDS